MKSALKTVLPLLILAAGAAAFVLLKSMQTEPQRIERPNLGPLVEVMETPVQRVQVVVEGQGTVRPDAQISLVPQVSGIVVWKDEAFKSGGAFIKGDVLFRIDPRDYELPFARLRRRSNRRGISAISHSKNRMWQQEGAHARR